MPTQIASSILSHRSFRLAGFRPGALLPLLLLALSLFLISGAPQLGGSAQAGCSPGSGTVTCNDPLPGSITYTSGVSTLDVNALTSSTSSVYLSGTGSSATNGIDTFSCSVSDGCDISSDSTTCTPKLDKDSNPLGACQDIKAPGGTGSAGRTIAVDVNAPISGAVTIGAGRSGVAVTGISNGANGGNGSNAYVFGDGGDGGNGANGGAATVTFTGQIPYASGGGLLAASLAGNGGDGGDFKGIGGSAGSGGQGGAGGNAAAKFTGGSISTSGDGNNGITAISRGGNGGSAGSGGGLVYVGGSGNSAGQAGSAEVDTSAGTTIYTYGNYANGIAVLSIGGGGGNGSGGFGLFYSGGGNGSTGGAGGTATVKAYGDIYTYDNNANGILAQSIGGGGGSAGSVSGAVALGGSGSGGGAGGTVSVENYGSITTSGTASNAIEAQSIGGGGGNGANSGGLFSMGGNGSGTTSGGSVTVTNDGTLTTGGTRAAGIVAQSIGGGGGNGGTSGGLFAFGGSGGAGANGGTVTVTNGGSITTTATGAAGSPGILAQSIGGGGGNGGGSVSASVGPLPAVAFGGNGGMAGNGSTVTILADSHSYEIQTAGDNSSAIIAQSIGGGGGNGGFAVSTSANPLFSVALGTGGGGAAGGSAGIVSVTTNGSLTTTGSNSDGILAQSLGGGGGNGGFAISASVSAIAVSAGIGGSGGAGGSASGVTVDGHGFITTSGSNSIGISAQSIGGGGGNGGFAGSGSLALTSVSVGVGGSAGKGGGAQDVKVTNAGNVHTSGANSTGIEAQSIGGGGGNGGFSGTGTVTLAGGANIGVGGQGGSGGSAGAAWAQQSGSIYTEQANSTAILAQSIGGGGGNGGFAAGGSVGAAAALAVTVGGNGGAGQNALGATVVIDGNSQTVGDIGYGAGWNTVTRGRNSAAVVAQSIGGGGGNGGFSADVSLSAGASLGVALGGKGAGGGDGGAALIHNGYTYSNQVYTAGSNDILTTGDLSAGIVAQSIGGGGGNGGFAGSLSGALGGGEAGAFTLGGPGGAGGLGRAAEVDSIGNIHTAGNFSDGIIAQSIGGSGGNGGMSIAVSASTGAFGGAVAIGGTGGAGNDSQGGVQVTSTGTIVTEGIMSNGIFAQSIGGGGGNGGIAGSGSVAFGAGASLAIGGQGKGGGSASFVDVTNHGAIQTSGNEASAIVAQSIGGGGGNGGGSIGVALGGAAGLGVAVGGNAGAGGNADNVTVLSNGNLATGYGQSPTRGTSDAFGILAQSIGGGGGSGGYAGSVALGGALAGGVSVGGKGGAGGSAGYVHVTSTGDISTVFDNSAGIMAQSIGGGGGNGGFSFALSGSGAIEDVGGSASVSIGGGGDVAGQAMEATVTSTGNIHTQGDNSAGIVAQSIGGGGGSGGWSISGTASLGLAAVAVSVGGTGKGGGAGLAATVDSYGAAGKVLQSGITLETDGALSDGILAQSLGGGGGNGGWSVAAGAAIGGAGAGVSVGGSGAGGGGSAAVTVESYNNVLTKGAQSNGIAAQSLGGGGGNGGFSVGLGGGSEFGGSVSVGGSADSGGGSASTVTVTSVGTIETRGDMSNGILAQSIGGGGGNGGFSASGDFSAGAAGLGASVGGFGSSGGVADAVHVYSYGAGANQSPGGAWTISTAGAQSNGILAQSIGGGGGNGGFAVTGGITTGGDTLNVSVGGGGATGGIAGTVDVESYNNIHTVGAFSNAISAQSIGGGGGNGGFSVAGSGGTGFAASVAIGGSGASASDGLGVDVTSYGTLQTIGQNANGILAQSIGGGGGNGGFAITGTASEGVAVGANIGGTGKGGGKAGPVHVYSYANVDKSAPEAGVLSIDTHGAFADGILAQSIGGGGGNGGFSVGGGLSPGVPVNVSVGGLATGGGGNADSVTVESYNNIRTADLEANAISAQSIGGGGGNGGFAVTATGGGDFAAAVTVGGMSLSAGGAAQEVQVTSVGTLQTGGNGANGILAQSLGGGGGNGGFALAGAVALNNGAVSASIGGFGATGGGGGEVIVSSNVGQTLPTNVATIYTTGQSANGIEAQSVGGGGGNGGFSGGFTATVGAKASLSLSLGGFGGDGNTAAHVGVTSVDNIVTLGDGSNGILAQSVGGGGGSGGFSFAGTVSVPDGNSFSLSASLGGFGGSADDAGTVTVDATGSIQTVGTNANGVVAQSLGGGGGNGGLSVAGTFNFGSENNVPSVTASVGGFGGSGGAGKAVDVTRTGDITTLGDKSNGILAQSVGGSGGNGGLSIAGSLGGPDAKQISASVGGFGGAGSEAGDVTVHNTGNITTGTVSTAQELLAIEGDAQYTTVTVRTGTESNGILAQSIGGGGGNGGFAFSGAIGPTGENMTLQIGATIGGFGGSGGYAGAVRVTDIGDITTYGDRANGISAQSVGGGGGNGGAALTGLLSAGDPQAGGRPVSVAVSVGGFGGDGNVAGLVRVEQTGSITTYGSSSNGILAQSIGGGGGTGGNANTFAMQLGTSCTSGVLGKVISSCKAPKKPGVNVQVDVGGFGGTGNDANTVTVINHGAITTFGASSVGILAQSIGGGGGNGGQAIVGLDGLFPGSQEFGDAKTVVGLTFGASGIAQGLGKITVGGFGGASGDGKEVDVTNEGAIQTSGTSSHGIYAQSIGGGGGIGGNAKSGVTGLASVGGFGGGSGDGGTVKVINLVGGNITTTGDHSDAILAQSVGGGGGEGDIAGDNGTIDPTKQSASADVVNGQTITYPADASNDGTVAGNGGSASGLLALGGFGGASGNGGTVTVTNSALLSTSGDYSAGIVAQSVGGGGGNGGGTGLSGIAVGGFASVLGATGQGGDVTVTNNAVAPDASTATIYTKGLDAYGILAQSVGGSGGSGGGNSSAAGVTVGGSGGNAGDGGHVQVFNYGIIGTEGDGATGVLAQSVGGSGGTGGGAKVSLVTVGGRGGSGGKGGEVDITNTAVIQTKGQGASAIFGQSVGGGGGTGGGTSSTTALTGSLVSVGGTGDGGGIGGTVKIDNSGGLLTKGDKSYGIYAQSIGGGGGDGGLAIGLIAVGGGSTLSSDGGDVTVTNRASGQIETYGLMSDAIFAQSIGGGGGNGGGAWSGLSVGVSTSVGGTGGGGGKGGAVHVDNSAILVTNGADTEAIFAQSVGAGGGNGAMAGLLALQAVPGLQGIGVSLGGSGFTAGDGGEVKVNNFASGSITTNGANSTGIFAQSIGGGGGNGGYALTEATSVGTAGIAIGGSGGAAGNGGAVTVTNAGQILLNGNDNLGIMAQSVGGGGGVGADALGVGNVPVIIGGQSGAVGRGGDVKVVNSGTIIINGDNSAGLFAQSVGGGGGMVKPGGGTAAVTKAAGGVGNGGTVTIENSGAILVTGDNSAALFAQSVGGGGGVVGLSSDPPGQTGPFLFAGTSDGFGTAAAITVDQSKALVAPGMNSIALVAQSSSADGNGDITVNIITPEDATGLTLIEGGSAQGAGVFIREGATNTLNNGGYLTNVLDVNGYAVRATTGDDTVNNTAVMVGSVDLGTGANALNNQAGALFNSGTVVALGAGNLMTNSGLLSPGAFQNVMTTVVTGNFLQTSGGTYGLDLQLSQNIVDEITVTGTANVQGTTVIDVMSPGLAQSGTHEKTIVHADGGIVGPHGLTLAYVPTAVTTYSLVYPNPDDIDLKYVIDFSPGGLTINQHSVGNAINAIQAAPTTNAFTPIAAALFYQPTVKQLGAVYDSLSGEGVAGSQQAAFTAADRFVSVIGQQMNFWTSGEDFAGNGVIYTEKQAAGPLAYAEQPRVPSPFGALPKAGPVEPAPFWRLWASGFGGNGSQKGDAEVGSAQLQYRGAGAAMGVEYHPSTSAMLGAAIGGSQSVFGVDDRATSGHFDAAHLGIYGAWRDEHLYVQGTAAFSTFDNRYERHAAIPGITLGSLGGVAIPSVGGFDERLKGTFDSRIFGGRLETGWRIHAAPGIDVSPFAAVELSRLETNAFTEQQTSGKASQIGLSYASRAIPSVPIFLGTQIDGRVAFENGMELHSWIRAAWVHEFDPNRTIDPSFIAAPGYDFIIQGARAASDSARIDGGLQVKMSKDVSLFGNVSADVSGVGHTFTAGGGLRISW